jgi:protocatechuate 3,4-dioxygenase beta subunit
VLTGLVTTFAGQPAAGARVTVGGEGPARMTTTDARGRFSITALRAGRYYVSVSKPGYVSVTYGQRRVNSQGTAVPLGDGETRDIAVQLPRGGVITGMVLDERGEPAVNAFVRVMRFVPGAGERQPQQAGGDNTDDRGIYRVHSLQPGDYAVCATLRGMGPQNDAQRIQSEIDMLRRSMTNAPTAGARQQMATRLADLQGQLPAQTEPMTGYANVCFPGSSPTASTTIPLAAGEEKGGVDLQMQLTQMARVEGTLIAPPGVELRAVRLGLANADDAAMPVEQSFAEVDNQGTFVFQSVPPGRYKVLARSMPMNQGPSPPNAAPAQQPPRLWANAEVTVAGQDINGIVLQLQRGATISGQLVFQASASQPPADLSRASINIFPSAPQNGAMMMGFGGNSQPVVEPGGRFTISDVFPGNYRVSAGWPGSAGAPTWLVQSITVEGEDVLDAPLEVKGRRAISGMVITMTDRITELSGTVADQKGKPATEQTLLLYPVDQKYWVFQSRRIRTTRASEDGHYIFRGVPPGDYRLTTLVDPEPGSWYDKAVLSELDSSSIRISLAEGEKRVEHVRIR